MVLPELRPARENDRPFIFESYKATLREHVEWAWGWNESFQRDGFWRHHPLVDFQVISAGEVDAGAMHVEAEKPCNFVRMIFLLPPYQREGFGSALLRREVIRARKEGKSLDLKGIKSNPAKLLYDRLGFVVVEESDATYHMRSV